MSKRFRLLACLSAALVLSLSLSLTATRAHLATAQNAPDLKDLDNSQSEVKPLIERYVVDRGSLTRSYPVELSPARQTRFKQFYADWLAALTKLDFDTMSQDGK